MTKTRALHLLGLALTIAAGVLTDLHTSGAAGGHAVWVPIALALVTELRRAIAS